jgi:hypothetical protein
MSLEDSFLVSIQKSQVLEMYKHEKHVNESHSKRSHKVEVLARIYFSATG